jgi:hypothetical protein
MSASQTDFEKNELEQVQLSVPCSIPNFDIYKVVELSQRNSRH